jgi:hypothetical protein
MDSKAFWSSLGFWGIAAEAVLVAAETNGYLPESTFVTIGQFGALVVALYGRWRATKPLAIS